MTHRMYITKTEVVFLTKFVKPEVRSVVIHRFSVPLDEKAVIVDPFAAEFIAFLVLLGFVGF